MTEYYYKQVPVELLKQLHDGPFHNEFFLFEYDPPPYYELANQRGIPYHELA